MQNIFVTGSNVNWEFEKSKPETNLEFEEF